MSINELDCMQEPGREDEDDEVNKMLSSILRRIKFLFIPFLVFVHSPTSD